MRLSDLIVTAQNRVDRAFGGNAKVAVEPADQQLADFAGAPMRLFPLGCGDEAFRSDRDGTEPRGSCFWRERESRRRACGSAARGFCGRPNAAFPAWLR